MASTVKRHTCSKCPYTTTLTAKMKSLMMSNSLPKRQTLFDCAVPIESFKCLQCANFQTHNLTHLKRHAKAGHTLPDRDDETGLHTHFEFLSSSHQLLDACIGGGEVKSEAGIPEATTDVLQFRENDRDSYPYNPSCSSRLTDPLQIDTKPDEETLLKCEYCRFKTKVAAHLDVHMVSNHRNADRVQWFKCEHCSYATKQEHNLTKHVACRHERRLKCAQCAYAGKTRATLRRHVLLRHTNPENIEWVECQQCTYKGKTRNNLVKHIQSKHTKIEYVKCERCRFQTRSKYSLRDHILRKHTNVKRKQTFQCEKCTYTSRRKYPVEVHMRCHHSEPNT